MTYSIHILLSYSPMGKVIHGLSSDSVTWPTTFHKLIVMTPTHSRIAVILLPLKSIQLIRCPLGIKTSHSHSIDKLPHDIGV